MTQQIIASLIITERLPNVQFIKSLLKNEPDILVFPSFSARFRREWVNIMFVVVNIDLLDETPTGQNTFHGTVIMINQRAEEGEPVNQLLLTPKMLLSPTPLAFEVKYLQEQIINRSQFDLRHTSLESGEHDFKYFTHIWALDKYFITDDNDVENLTDQQVLNEEQPVT